MSHPNSSLRGRRAAYCGNTTAALTTAIACVVLGALFSGCNAQQRGVTPPKRQDPKAAAQDDKPVVFASSYPLAYFTKRLIHPHVRVEFPVPPDQDPVTWRPSAEQMRQLQAASLIVVNGRGLQYANWMTHVTLPESRMCRTIDGLDLATLIVVPDYTVHSHGPEGEHSHSGLVPNVWLDPTIAADQARHIAECLIRVWPEHSEAIHRNLEELVEELIQLSAEMDTIGHTVPTPTTVLTSAPNFKYWTRRVGVNDVHLHWSNRRGQPDERQWGLLDELLTETVAGVMLWPRQPPDEVVQQLQQRDISVLVIDLVDHPPAGGDYFSAMRDNLQRIKAVLLPDGSPMPAPN